MRKLFIVYFIISFGCSENKNTFTLKTSWNGKQKIERFLSNDTLKLELIYESVGVIKAIRTNLSDSVYEELVFDEGKLISKMQYNRQHELEGNSYFFYPSGNLKSTRSFKHDKYFDMGRDYYDYSGIDHRHIFYDSTGTYYYGIEFDETNSDYGVYFNHNNPLAYRMISLMATEPTRTKLMKLMESIGLDSLKQIH